MQNISQPKQPQREALMKPVITSESIWGDQCWTSKTLCLFMLFLSNKTAPTSSTYWIQLSSQCSSEGNSKDIQKTCNALPSHKTRNGCINQLWREHGQLNMFHIPESDTCTVTQYSIDFTNEELVLTKTTPKRSTYEKENHQWLHLRWSELDSQGETALDSFSCDCHLKLPQQVALTAFNKQVNAHVGVIGRTEFFTTILHELCEGKIIVKSAHYPNKLHLLLSEIKSLLVLG